LCFFHGNPNKASELGRKGGRSKHKIVPGEAEPLPTLDTLKSVHEMSKRLFEECYLGKRPQKDTQALVRLLQLLTDSIRFTNVEERLAKLEQARAQSVDNHSPQGAVEDGEDLTQ
jgi:hypothetical protein